MRAAREPMAAATSPYVITRPGGMESTTATTREAKSVPSPGAGSCASEVEGTDRLAVLGLADRLEAAAQEELFGAELAGLPDHVQAVVAAPARLVRQRAHRERSD